MTVLTSIKEGLPEIFAASIAALIASKSVPSLTKAVCQP